MVGSVGGPGRFAAPTGKVARPGPPVDRPARWGHEGGRGRPWRAAGSGPDGTGGEAPRCTGRGTHMSSATTTTIVGNLTRDPEIRYTRDGPGHHHPRGRGQPPVAEPGDQRVGGVHLVLRRGHLAGPGRERGPEPDQGDAGGGDRPARAAQLGDRGRRPPVQGRDRRRRGRSRAALRHRRRAPGRSAARRRRRPRRAGRLPRPNGTAGG